MKKIISLLVLSMVMFSCELVEKEYMLTYEVTGGTKASISYLDYNGNVVHVEDADTPFSIDVKAIDGERVGMSVSSDQEVTATIYYDYYGNPEINCTYKTITSDRIILIYGTPVVYGIRLY